MLTLIDSDVIQAREAYRERGLTVFSLAPRDKRKMRIQWNREWNIALKLGEPGGYYVVDLDDPLAVGLAPRFLPPTGLISGITVCPRAHYWYRGCGDERRLYFRGPRRENRLGRVLLEYRGKGIQVVPPSIHPSGYRYVWSMDGEAASVGAEELVASVRALHAELLRFS